MRPDQHIVICGTEKHIEGSRLIRCTVCSTSLWAAPSSLNMVGAVPVCFACALTLIERDDNPVLIPPTPEQMAEVEVRYPEWTERDPYTGEVP